MNKTIKLSEVTNFSEKQKHASKMADLYKFLLYGGAAGGGKSYWLRWYPIKRLLKWYNQYQIKGVVFGLFCEDYPSLKDRHLTKMKMEFPEWLGTLGDSSTYGLSFRLRPEFGGGVLALRNLDDPSKYFSSEFAGIAVDELTKNQKETFDFLRMRLRWPGIPDTKFIAGTNPGSVGHEWVKKMWIEKDHASEEKESSQFFYVPATVDDNPHIDPNYITSLESLPEKLQRAYRYGDWDIFEGQFFTEFMKEKHVVKPFQIPSNWKKFRSIDVSGRNGITSCHWYAVDQDGTVWVYREHYGTGMDSDQHATRIAELSENEQYGYTIIDNAAFAKLGLPETTAEVYERCGVTGLIPSSKDREAGWDIMHQYLRWDEMNEPKMKIFTTCPNLIRTIPLLVHDELHPEDVDTRGEDHGPDEARYFLQTLRMQKAPRSESLVERRLRELKERENELSFSYRRKSI